MAVFIGGESRDFYINPNAETQTDVIDTNGGDDLIFTGLKINFYDPNDRLDQSLDFINGGAGVDTLNYNNIFGPSFYDVNYPIRALFDNTGKLFGVTKGSDRLKPEFGADFVSNIENIVAPFPTKVDSSTYNFRNLIDISDISNSASTPVINLNLELDLALNLAIDANQISEGVAVGIGLEFDTLIDISSPENNPNVNWNLNFNMKTGAFSLNGNQYNLQNFQDVITGIGNDIIIGNDFDNLILTEEGNDRISGHNGDDVIRSGIGNDILNAGNAGLNGDILDGGFGDDILVGGGSGRKFMLGGAGRDIFTIGQNQGFAVIQDFTIGEDQIGLSGLNFGSISQTSTFAGLFISQGALAFDFSNVIAQVTNQITPLNSSNFINNYVPPVI